MLGTVMPVRMADGKVIFFPSPRFVAFDLIEAKRHVDRGIRLRERALSHLRVLQDGTVTITDKQSVLDCFAVARGGRAPVLCGSGSPRK